MLQTWPTSRAEHRGVVARAGADVEHALVARQREQLAHAGDDERLRDRLPRADRQRDVVPRLLAQARRDEAVARHVRIAASTRASLTCGRSRSSSRARGSSALAAYATDAPAAASSSRARSAVAGLRRRRRARAARSTRTVKPSRRASSAVF